MAKVETMFTLQHAFCRMHVKKNVVDVHNPNVKFPGRESTFSKFIHMLLIMLTE